MPSGRGPRRSSAGGIKAASSNVLHHSDSRGRVTKRGRSRGASSTNARRPPSHKPYIPIEYPPTKALYFAKTNEWDPTRLVEGIKMVNFGDEFEIKDMHLDSIVGAGPAFCHSLQDIRSGDSESGAGGSLNDTAVVQLAAACPNLLHASLDGSKHLTDTSLIAFFTNCPNLRYLLISGNDKVSGNVEGTALDKLRDNPEWGKKLEKVRLTDQNEVDKKFKEAVRKLSAARQKLAIEVGETDPRDGFVNTWLAGREKMGYQAIGGGGGFDQYGG